MGYDKSIPLAIENTALVAALIQPNHIVFYAHGVPSLPPPRDHNGFWYIFVLYISEKSTFILEQIESKALKSLYRNEIIPACLLSPRHRTCHHWKADASTDAHWLTSSVPYGLPYPVFL